MFRNGDPGDSPGEEGGERDDGVAGESRALSPLQQKQKQQWTEDDEDDDHQDEVMSLSSVRISPLVLPDGSWRGK